VVGRGGGRLGAEPRVRGVDDHPASLVLQQVEAVGPRGGEGDGRRARIQRDPGGAGEVVAGAKRQQPHRHLIEPAQAAEPVDDHVQAAIPAGHHRDAAVQPRQDAVQGGGITGHVDLGRTGSRQHPNRRVECLTFHAARVGVGDHLVAMHAPQA
jgi:hypothetical protein